MKKMDQNRNQNKEDFLTKELRESPFSVPAGYFATLKGEILLRKEITDTAESSFLVPSHYQESLKTAIHARIAEEKLRTVLETETLPLPNGYFDDLQQRILSKTTLVKEVLPIKRKPTHHWFSYAAAACIALAIGIFSIMQWDNVGYKKTVNEQAKFETLPTQEIINYLSFYSEPEDLLYLSEQLPAISSDFTDDLSTEEIEAYLKNSI